MTLHIMLGSLSWKNKPTFTVHDEGLDATKFTISSNDKTKLQLKLRLSSLQSTTYERIIHFFIIFLCDKSNSIVAQTYSPLIKLVKSHVPKHSVEEKMADKLIEAILEASSTAKFDVTRACFVQGIRSNSSSGSLHPTKLVKTSAGQEVYSPNTSFISGTEPVSSNPWLPRYTCFSYRSSYQGWLPSSSLPTAFLDHDVQ